MRAAFVNCGFLGHGAMADVMHDVARLMSVDAVHVNLSEGLTPRDRILRRALSIQLAPSRGRVANVDLRRWRQEMNLGLVASRRLEAAEGHGPFDVLHFHTQSAAYASLGRMARTPTVVSIDATSRLASLETASTLARWTYAPNVAHDGAVFRRARAIVATSAWAARDLASLYPDCGARTHVLPYPIRDVFGPDPSADRASATDGASGQSVRVLFVGGDFLRKGGPELLDAWRAAQFGARATLDIVSDWPIAAGALPNGVRVVRGVTPYSPAWVDAWRRADLFVMPSAHEAFGIVFEEAAAAGLPSIGTAINAIPEIIVDGETGLLVAPGDPGALVRALRTLIDAPAMRRQLGAAARRRVRERAFPDVYAARLSRILNEAVRSDVSQS